MSDVTLTPEDESLLDELFDHAVACLATGERIDVESWLTGREHLRAAAESTLETARGVAVGTAPRLPHGKPPEVAGYRVLAEVGRGSMGIVYRAVQESLGRVVALKILAPSLLVSTRARERFAAEAQALARVQHPSVVTVHEVVVQPELCAYAMEWLQGSTLAQAIEAGDARLEPRRVGELGLALARALEAVHAAGLVHRDVKPSNVLLCFDGRTVLTDFGLAHSNDQGQGTASGEFLGTAAYAAPEQLRGERERIGPRSDVYSLGVTLYAALSGQTPFGTATPSAVLRRIEEGRAQPLAKLNPAVPRDLATIVAHAMEPELARRYASASELAEDLERFLTQRPIRARRASLALRGKRWVQRNPWLSVALVVLVAGAGTSTWFALEASERAEEALEQKGLAEQHEAAARSRAEENARLASEKSALASAESAAKTAAESSAAEARQRAAELEQVLEFQRSQWNQVNAATMGFRLRSSLLQRVSAEQRAELEQSLVGIDFAGIARTQLVVQLFERWLAQLRERFHDQPTTRATLLQNLASLLRVFGFPKRSEAPQEEALALRLEHRGEEHVETLRSLREMGLLKRDAGRFEDAEQVLRQALASSVRLLGADHEESIEALQALGTTLTRRGAIAEAEALEQEALERSQRTLGDDHLRTLTALNNVGSMLHNQGRLEEAEPLLRQALEGARRRHGTNAPVTFQFMQNLGVLLSARSKAKEAEELLRAALEGRRKIVGEDHPDTLASKESLGVMLAGRGKLREGEELLRAVLEARRRLLGGDHASTIQITSQLASLLEMKNERAAAESLLSEAYASIQRTKSYARPEAAWIVSQLVELLQKRGELAAAERIATETLAAQRQSELAPSVSTIRTMTSLGLILHQQGKLGEAEVELRAVLPLLRKRDGDQGSTTQMVAMVLASILVKSSRCPEAVDLLESFETPALPARASVADRVQRATFLQTLGRAQMGIGTVESFVGAEKALLEAYERSLALGAKSKFAQTSAEALVALYQAWQALAPSAEHAQALAKWQALVKR